MLLGLEDVAGDSTLLKQSDFVSEHVVSISRSKREVVTSAIEMTSCRVLDWVQDIASERRRLNKQCYCSVTTNLGYDELLWNASSFIMLLMSQKLTVCK
jgi:hypothetical protein